MKTLLKQSKLIEKLILDEDEDISLTTEENIGESKIFSTEDRIKELEAIKKERPLTEDELEELAYCKNEVDSRDAETRYLNGESLEEAKVDYIKTDKYGKYGTEVVIYHCLGDEITPEHYFSNIKGFSGKSIDAKTLDELEKKIVDAVNSEDKKADNTILNDSLKEDVEEDVEEDDLLELEEPIDEEPVEEVSEEIANNAYLTEINDLIANEYNKIDTVKSLITTFTTEDAIESNSDVISILNTFIDTTTIGIGMLTKATELIDSTTNDLMQQGIEQAEEVINNEIEKTEE